MKRMLTREEHNALFAFLESKCLTLWDVENNENGIYREFAQTAFPMNLTSIQNVSASDEIIIFQNSSFIRYQEECEKAYRNDSSVFVVGNVPFPINRAVLN